MVNRTQHDLHETGERELSSRAIAEADSTELKKVDQAYVRFASVYRDFHDISEFSEEIARLEVELEGS